MKNKELLKLVAKSAASQLPVLPPLERADLLEGIALILPASNERELARHTAGLIRQSEEHQLKLFKQLNGGAA